MPKDNDTTTHGDVLRVAATQSRRNGLHFMLQTDSSSNVTTLVGIRDFYVFPHSLYEYVQSGMRAQRRTNKKGVDKKWRVGVGVGVGVGVPPLMMVSYVLGRKQGKKKLSSKQTK